MNLYSTITDNAANNDGIAGILFSAGAPADTLAAPVGIKFTAPFIISRNTANYNTGADLEALIESFFDIFPFEPLGAEPDGFELGGYGLFIYGGATFAPLGGSLGGFSSLFEVDDNIFCFNNIDLLNIQTTQLEGSPGVQIPEPDGLEAGDNNKCDVSENWADEGLEEGCTYACFVPEKKKEEEHHGPIQWATYVPPAGQAPPVVQPPLPAEEALLNIDAPEGLQDGQEFDIIVTDDEGNPVEGATVTYAGQTAVTGPGGRAIFFAAAGAEEMKAEKAGYTASEIVVSVLTPLPPEEAPPEEAPPPVVQQPKAGGIDWLLVGAIIAVIALLALVYFFLPKTRK
jgi:hypothetical protein